MASVRTWTLKIRGDSSDAVTAADKVAKRYKGLGDSINRDLSGSLGRTEGRFARFRTSVSSTGSRVAAVFGGAAVAGVAALGAGLVSTFNAAQESLKVTRQTDQVLKTMGATSWTSANQVGELAGRLSNMSGVDDELIQNGANLILTFKNIRNETGRGNAIFDRTVAVANDMSVALGQDMKSSSIQLGKALNDPVKGVSALQRVGVSFTQKQKDQIKTLVDSGKTLQAQKMILKEVETQFGGTAAAVGTPWDKLKVSLGNVQEEIGGALLPMVNSMVGWFSEKIPAAIDKTKMIFNGFLGAFREGDVTSDGIVGVAERMGVFAREAWPHVQKIAGAIRDFAVQAKGFFKENPAVAFTILGTVLGGLVLAAVVGLAGALLGLLSPFVLVLAAVAAVAGAVVYAWTNWEGFRNVVMAVVNWFTGTAWPALQAFADYVIEKFGQMVGWMQDIWPKVQEAITHVINVIRDVISGFVNVVQALWDRFGSTILGFVTTVWNSIYAVIAAVINVIRGIIETVLAVINGDWAAAWDGIKRIVSGVWSAIKAVISAALAVIVLILSTAWQTIQAVTGFVWRAILAILTGVWNGIKAAVGAALGFLGMIISTAWNGITAATSWVWNGIKTIVSGAWNGIKSAVGGAIGWVRDKIESVLGTISGIWSKVWGGMKDALGGIWDGIKDGVRTGVNAVIKVVNWFIRLINNIPGVDIKELDLVGDVGGSGKGKPGKRATGGFLTNQGGRGAQYVVGEGNRFHPEAVIATDPKYRKRNQALVAWAADKLGMGAPGFALGGIPNPVSAVKDIAGTAWRGLKGIAGVIRSSTLRPFFDTAKNMVDRLPIPGGWDRQIKGFGKDVLDRMYRWAAGKADETAGKGGPGGGPGPNQSYSGGGVERWRSTALQALQMTGSPLSWIGSLLRRMNQESGGNPNAINNWDSNARRGDPSGGLMQNIRSAYPSRVAGFPSLRGTNFLHPLGSIVASIVYANQRYGSAPRGWDRPGGYRRGGILGFANGGVLGEDVMGVGLATGRRHLMHRGEQITSARESSGPRTEVHIGRLVVGGDTPGEVRRNAHIFMDTIERRQIEHEARGA